MEIANSNDKTVVDALYRHVAIRPSAPAFQSGDKILINEASEHRRRRHHRRSRRDLGRSG